MRGEDEGTVIRVTADADHRTVTVSGVLDGAAVAAVCAATEQASTQRERLVLDLIGVTSVQGDCLRRLAQALRESGVNLDILSPPSESR